VAGGAATRGRERFLLGDFLEERLGVLAEMKGRVVVVLRALLLGDDNVTIEAEAETKGRAIAIGFFQNFITEREGCAAFALGGGGSRALRESLKRL
jgi:hypothetical protein